MWYATSAGVARSPEPSQTSFMRCPCSCLCVCCLLTVLRLKDHSDAADAARAFDRAALCLARAGMGSRNPELNFPAKDYEGESLPDLRGAAQDAVSLHLPRGLHAPVVL